MNLFSNGSPDITTASEHPEVQKLTERVGSLRSDIRSHLRTARENERKAREVEDEATGGGDVALVGEVAEFEEKAEAARSAAKKKSDELAEVEERCDALAEEVDAEAQEKIDKLRADALRESADATEQAVEAHRRLRKIQTTYSDYIGRGPRHPDAKHWLYRGSKHGSGGVQWVEWARRVADEIE